MTLGTMLKGSEVNSKQIFFKKWEMLIRIFNNQIFKSFISSQLDETDAKNDTKNYFTSPCYKEGQIMTLPSLPNNLREHSCVY